MSSINISGDAIAKAFLVAACIKNGSEGNINPDDAKAFASEQAKESLKRWKDDHSIAGPVGMRDMFVHCLRKAADLAESADLTHQQKAHEFLAEILRKCESN